jgi:hypothetical protein
MIIEVIRGNHPGFTRVIAGKTNQQRETGKYPPMPRTNECLKKTLELAELMLQVADEGDAARQDVGCGVLYGLLRDSGYRIKKLAEAERQAHIKKGGWQD